MEFTATMQNSTEPPVDGSTLDVEANPFYFALVTLQVMSPSAATSLTKSHDVRWRRLKTLSTEFLATTSSRNPSTLPASFAIHRQ